MANNFNLAAQTQALKRYITAELPGMAARKTLRFINGNFRAQGYQGRVSPVFPRFKRH